MIHITDIRNVAPRCACKHSAWFSLEPLLAVCGLATGINKEELLGKSTRRQIVRPRWAIWHVASINRLSSSVLGRIFGKDHSTVVHGLKQAKLLIQSDPDFAALVAELEAV